MIVLGGRPYKFIPEGETQERTGWTVWALEDAEQGRGIGRLPVKLGFSNEQFESVVGGVNGLNQMIGKQVDVSFNRYGKAQHIAVVAK